MNASHTHCGPELRGDRLVRFGIDPKYAAMSRQYVRDTAGKIGNLVVAMLERLEPSRLIYSRARAGFAMNRRLPTKDGFVNSPNPEGPIDHDVPVLRAVTAGGKLSAILFGYACHATTLGFQQLCGDYPGFAQQYLEAAHEGTVALFLNGCSADQNPYPRRTLELAQQHGRALANGVETALETKNTHEIHGPLRVALDYTTLKFAGPPTREEVEAEAASDNKYARFHGQALLDELDRSGKIETEYSSFPIQAAQFGNDLTLVAICGEVVVDYSLRLKKDSPRTTATSFGLPDTPIMSLAICQAAVSWRKEVMKGAARCDTPSFPDPSTNRWKIAWSIKCSNWWTRCASSTAHQGLGNPSSTPPRHLTAW